MEFSLHRQLKSFFASPDAEVEVPVEGYRIDVVDNGELIEVQLGGLSALRDKLRKLVVRHDVRVIKPLIARKRIHSRVRKGGKLKRSRLSPKRETWIDLFHELVHFTQVFPHERLALQVVLIEIEEWRYPGHGKRRRRRARDFQIEDRKLVEVDADRTFRKASDLWAILPKDVPPVFDTQELAQVLESDRWIAQRVAYCLYKMGAVERTGKRGNAWIYERT